MLCFMGLSYDRVEIEPYNPEWAREFENEKNVIDAAINNSSAEVCHIGSTSIPGMPSKPIIDIMVGVDSYDDYPQIIEALEMIGYHCLGECGRPGRIFFVKGELENNTNHLHLVLKGGRYWKEFILFRDYLKANSDLAAAYARIKKQLAERYKNDRTSYRICKSLFVDEILNEIRLESKEICEKILNQQKNN